MEVTRIESDWLLIPLNIMILENIGKAAAR